MCSCVVVFFFFFFANICDNIIWDPTSGIKPKVRVEAMAGEEGKASRIEKFDGTNFGYWRMQIEDYLCKVVIYNYMFCWV